MQERFTEASREEKEAKKRLKYVITFRDALQQGVSAYFLIVDAPIPK